MILAFETETLRSVCEDESVASHRLGAEVAAELRARLADLRAATSTADLLVGAPRFTGPRLELLTIDLGQKSFMIWIANHVPPRHNLEGNVDWGAVIRIRLLEIEGLR